MLHALGFHAVSRRHALVLLALVSVLFIDQPRAISSGLVISQIYGGGGNTGAQYTNDFVEIFNRSGSPISLNGKSVQYASATGTGNFGASTSQLVALPDVMLASGGYFLVQLGGGATGIPLPTPDATGTIAMSASAGKVALVDGTASLGCNGGSAPCSAAQLAQIIDLVGYGSANFFEGTAAPALTNTTAALRAGNGCTESDNNFADFASGTPAPRNVASPPAPCGVTGPPTLSIADAVTAEGNGPVTLRFTVSLSAPSTVDVFYAITTSDETANAGPDYVGVSLPAQVIPAGSTTATHDITIAGDFVSEPTETFAVTLSQITGAVAGDVVARGTITNDDVPEKTIAELQGAAGTSPFVGTVAATRGIVTARKVNGFFLQTPDSLQDANPATSEAIFVFTSTAPTVAEGDDVRVAGTVVEFRSTSAALPGTLTEITAPSVTVFSTGNPLPSALQLADLLAAPQSFTSRAQQFERYESMLVGTASMDVVAPANTFGELQAVITGVTRPFREPGVDVSEALPVEAPATVPRFDSNFERVMVDTDDITDAAGVRRPVLDLPAGTPAAPVRLQNVYGPLDYAFDSYRVAVTPITVAAGTRVAAPIASPAPSEFTFASLNLENFRDGTPNFDQRKQKAARLIVEMLRTPDILGLIEVGDLQDLQDLAGRVNTLAGTNYQAYLEDGDGVVTGFEQNVGFLVNDTRIQTLGTQQVYRGNTFLFGGVTDLLHDRPPFVLEARVRHTGTDVVVILNHLKSLIDVNSQAPFGTSGLTEGARNREKRRLQAEDLANLIATRASSNLVVLGDMNAFEFNDGLVDVVGTIKGTPVPFDQVTAASTDIWSHQLTNLADLVPAGERYSYVFDGSAQVLDHVLVNDQMLSRLTRFEYAHLNADFPERLEADFTVPVRLSDHDAPIAVFSAKADLDVTASVAASVVAGGTADAQITLLNRLDAASNVTLSATLPSGVAWQSMVAPAGWSCSSSGSVVTCVITSLDAASTANLSIAGTVGCGVAHGTVLSIPVTATSATPDVSLANNSASATATVTNAPPTISGVDTTPRELRIPLLHVLLPVRVDYVATDTCGPVSTSLSVTSNEPVTGAGMGLAGLTSPDWYVNDDHRVWLRSERSPRGTGRVYTITITAIDQAGGTATATTAVNVDRR